VGFDQVGHMTYTERAKNEVNHTVMPACETDVTVRNPALERGFCHLTAARRFFYALLPPFGKTPILPNRPAAPFGKTPGTEGFPECDLPPAEFFFLLFYTLHNGELLLEMSF
jgi:hypothetical protein